MPYQAFHTCFPEIGAREARSVILPDPGVPLPAGEYKLVEMYCNEPGCDCRRVFFYVISPGHPQPLAVVAYGWETRAFYARWAGANDPLWIDELVGPVLNRGSPQSELAPAVLELIEDVVLKDRAYIRRIKRHYRMFRDRIEEDARKAADSETATGSQPGAGPAPSGAHPRAAAGALDRKDPSGTPARNARCPCGSGKKYKKCCMRKD